MSDYNQAIEAAHLWLHSDPVFLDTETTGLGDEAEICEISIIDKDGRVLMDTLIRPSKPISEGATDVHGITNEMVAEAPTYRDIAETLHEILNGRMAIIYNAEFDARILSQTAKIAGDQEPFVCKFNCAMNIYSRFYGDWSHYHRSYRWQKLSHAAKQCSLVLPPDLHRARADAELTRLLFQHMAQTELEEDDHELG